jgi:hypothetical protein
MAAKAAPKMTAKAAPKAATKRGPAPAGVSKGPHGGDAC